MKSRGETLRATQLYAERHPGRRCPSRRTFDKLVQLFCETGSIDKPKRNRRKTKINEETETFVLQTFVWQQLLTIHTSVVAKSLINWICLLKVFGEF